MGATISTSKAGAATRAAAAEDEPGGRRLLGEPWHAWLALLVGVLAVSAHSASSLVLAVLMKPILADLGGERTAFASALTTRMLVMIATVSFAGQLTDRYGARKVLAAGALIVGSGTLAIATLSSLGPLYPIMAWMGPGQAALGSVAASALVMRLFTRHRAIAIGVLNGGDNLINSALPVAAAAVLVDWGWRAAVVALGAAFVLFAGLAFWALRPSDGVDRRRTGAPAGRPRLGDSLRALPWGDPRLVLVLLAYALIYAFVTSVQLHFHAFQTDIGRSPAEASRLLGIQILVGALGAPLFGWVAERYSARVALAIVVAGLTATSTVLWSASSTGAMTVWAVLYGLVNSGAVALLALVLSELFGSERIGHLMGVAMVFCMSSTMLANLYSAAMFDRFHSYVPVWQSYTALMLAALATVGWLLARGRAAASASRAG